MHMDDERPVEQVLDTIGDEQARTVLIELAEDSSSAKELAERLDMSLATIYRRIEELQRHDLISSRTILADDGNHYDEYEGNFSSTLVSIEDAEYDIQIFRDQNLPDRFDQLWKGLANNEG
jgi:DNA-binding transcriptional ArsR family regulator